jgi:hypothetical protein
MAFRKSLHHIGFTLSGIIGCFLMISVLPSMVFEQPGRAYQKALGRGSTGNLKRAYKRWVAECGSSSSSGPVIRLVWNKTLSSEYAKTKGVAKMNLEEASAHVRIRGCDDNRISEIWLVDNLPGPGRSLLPEAGDGMIHAGSLEFEGANSWLDRKIIPMQMRDFEVNWVVVARRDENQDHKGVLCGSTSLFQRLYRDPDQNTPSCKQGPRRIGGLAALHSSAVDSRGIAPPTAPDAVLINQGRLLFFNETFKRNGRTCGSCHPEENNFTIDPKFIATLAENDSLFAGDLLPALSESCERPQLMREVGLLLENTRRSGDLENKFTLRSVPHFLAMRSSPASPMEFDWPGVPTDDGLLQLSATSP